jgi:hypothetical protein
MWSIVRLAALAAIMTAGLVADSTAPSETSIITFSGCISGPCNPVDLFIAPFDTSLGTLDSVDWRLTASQAVKIDIDNCPTGEEAPLLNYAYSITTGSLIFGSSSTYTGTGSGTTFGGCAGLDDGGYSAGFQMQGAITTDLSQFITGGDVQEMPFLVSGTITASPVDPTIRAAVGAAFFIGNVDDDLTLVYNYTAVSSVPEPRPLALIAVAFLGGIMLIVKRAIASKNPS